MSVTSTAVLVEACCDSVHTARAAQAFGAGRIELCGPGDGGTTPSFGLIARCRDELHVPLHVMIRPHTLSFVYGDDDIDVMGNDIIAARARGADGIVLGPLHDDGSVHQEQLAIFIALARPMKVAFHRAFDRTPSAMAALDALLAVGVDYVLTAGHAATALEGADTLSALQRRAGAHLTVLAGGSIRGHNVRSMLERSGVREVHARSTDPTIIRDVVVALSSTTPLATVSST
ncbi:MAG: copper homeostasis protein CutC [Gemmatimonadaceae bacterium]|nr:copper homeostasis protein CutC [Gemmatimonadaceae bacterium]